jgi:hypothetical protein
MSLPAEIFADITDSITIVGHDEAAAGNRRTPRVHLRTHVQLLPWNNPSDSISVRIRDLSTDGLGVLHSQRMALDEQFVIAYPRCDETVHALYTIVYWEPLAENLYAIGAQFERLIDEAELAARKTETTQTPAESEGVINRLSHVLSRRRKAS